MQALEVVVPATVVVSAVGELPIRPYPYPSLPPAHGRGTRAPRPRLALWN